jgi:hypothetical protein
MDNEKIEVYFKKIGALEKPELNLFFKVIIKDLYKDLLVPTD